MSRGRSSYLVGRAFRSFLAASVLTAAASQVGALVDGMMLSHFISPDAMSAINICMPVTQTLYALCILLGVGGTMLAGQAIGNGRREDASGIYSAVLAGGAALGVVVGVGGWLFLGPLVDLLCPDPALRQYTYDYLLVVLPCSILYVLMIVTQLFVTLDGSPRRVTAAVAVSMLVNLTLDYVAIVGLGWGITGAALATVASYVAALCVLGLHFRKSDLRVRIPVKASWLRTVATMGLPFGVATALIAVQLLGSNLVAINYLGNAGIVSLSVCMYMLSFSMIILTGTLESFQPVAAILKGAGDNRGVMLVLGRAYMFMFGALVLLDAALVFFPDFIGQIFGISHGATLDMLCSALPAYAVNIALQCAIYMLIPVYQLFDNRSLALVISVGQPLLQMFGFYAFSALDVPNPWWGFATGQLTVALVLLPFALARRGKHVPFFLVPVAAPDRIFDVTMRPVMQEMGRLVEKVDSWLRENEIPELLRYRVQLGLEENLKNIIEHGLGARAPHSAVDVTVTLDEDAVRCMIRDEGVPFNPLGWKRDEDHAIPTESLGIHIVHKTTDEERYEHIFHQNLLKLGWKR